MTFLCWRRRAGITSWMCVGMTCVFRSTSGVMVVAAHSFSPPFAGAKTAHRARTVNAKMCSELPLGLSMDFPLQRWLREAEARVSGYVLLAGNASAHERALECQLRATARDRPELLQIASRSAWHELSCADGCPSLADDVARLMRERTGRWSVVLVQAAVGLGLGCRRGRGRGLGHAAKHRLRRHRARDAS